MEMPSQNVALSSVEVIVHRWGHICQKEGGKHGEMRRNKQGEGRSSGSGRGTWGQGHLVQPAFSAPPQSTLIPFTNSNRENLELKIER